ncbi:MAG: prolipoprotein diacylglyceryl transferase [Chloroflexi bacterium]|nr:prolipoprotein diacylglyceryl transferase [Chloroflexota bacterium]
MPAVLSFTFDPVLHLSDTASVRLETVGLAIVLFVALLLAARAASTSLEGGLRLDDLVFMVIGAVPGAIIGGRTGYVLDHLDYYRANPTAMFDPAQGSLTLTLAVPLGLLTGSIVARLLGAPIGRWMQALALPILFALAAGKLIGVLGGSGQGAPSDLSWATAYDGPGPWGSLAADVPSHPSQVYEGVLVGLAVAAMAIASRLPSFARADGTALFLALGLWAVARFTAAFTWRDPAAVGPLRMDQALLVGVLVIALVGLIGQARYRVPTTTIDTTPAEEPQP